ncbi:MAG: PAS domain-containing protein, partial [Candidatus Aenigmatarchaeota archaeon]
GKGREEVAMKALNLGADRYLQKGKDPKSQYGVLAQAIEQEVEHYLVEKRLKLTSFSLEKADIGTYWISPDGVIEYANEWVCQKLGYDRGEIIGQKVSDINLDYSADDRPERWKLLKEKGSLTFES